MLHNQPHEGLLTQVTSMHNCMHLCASIIAMLQHVSRTSMRFLYCAAGDTAVLTQLLQEVKEKLGEWHHGQLQEGSDMQ